MKNRRVVITGMGLVSCFGNEVDTFYRCLLEGKSGVRKIQKFPCDDYPTQIAAEIPEFNPGDYIDKKQARRVDPCIAYAMVAGKRALEHAQIALESSEGVDYSRYGVIVGSGMGGMDVFADNVQTLIEKGYRKVSPFFVPYTITNMPSALLAIDLGFMGPNYSVSTACATSNYAIIAAANYIRQGQADVMLCGGTEAPIVPVGLAGFIACKALSTRNEEPEKASRPWDQQRDGFVMGEGAGVFVLEELEHALARNATIYAEYLGGGISCDAHHITEPRNDGKGVALCIRNAIADANITLDKINYINAHGTSTPLGDLAEVNAIKQVFPDGQHLKMNSTKSMIGHCLGAAGALEAIACVQAIRTGKLHPTINHEFPEPNLGIDIVPNHSIEFQVECALSNSFGFGGHNSSIIIGRYNPT